MKISSALLCATIIANTAWAQKVEPYGEMHETIVVVFRRDSRDVVRRAIAASGQLQGVEVEAKSKQPKMKLEVRHLDFPKGSWMRQNADQLDVKSLTLWWTPPKAPPQRISEGGKYIRSLRSSIDIDIASLRGKQSPTAVFLRRRWDYRGLGHIPYTEVPLPPLRTSDSGSYSSDKAWVRNLALGVQKTEFKNTIIYSPEVLSSLKKQSGLTR